MQSADMEKRGRERKEWVVCEVGVERQREREGESQRPLSESRSAVFKLGQVSN